MEKSSELKLFNQLFADYQGRFIRFAYNYVRDQSVAEDFTIDALMYYWEHRDSLSAETNVPAYVLTILKNKCLNHLQHLQVRNDAAEILKRNAEWALQTRIASLQACEPYEIFTAEAEQIIHQTLLLLPEQTRKIFMLSRYENKSHKEIAALTGMTTKGVEFHVSKALKLLRENLKDYLPSFLFLL